MEHVVIILSQVRAICVQITYHSKLEMSSLSRDFKNAHRSPAELNLKKSNDQSDKVITARGVRSSPDCTDCMLGRIDVLPLAGEGGPGEGGLS